MIRKLKSGKYRLYSEKKDPKTGKRKNLGTFTHAKPPGNMRRMYSSLSGVNGLPVTTPIVLSRHGLYQSP